MASSKESLSGVETQDSVSVKGPDELSELNLRLHTAAGQKVRRY